MAGDNPTVLFDAEQSFAALTRTLVELKRRVVDLEGALHAQTRLNDTLMARLSTLETLVGGGGVH